MEVDSEEERSRSLQEIDMTLAADEAQGMPMAHNYDVFDGHAYFTEDVLDLQQNTIEIFFLLLFLLKMLSQVVFGGQHGRG